MEKIVLAGPRRYHLKGRIFSEGKVYTVTQKMAEKLLALTDSVKGYPIFKRWEPPKPERERRIGEPSASAGIDFRKAKIEESSDDVVVDDEGGGVEVDDDDDDVIETQSETGTVEEA